MTQDCVYCDLAGATSPEPFGGWIYRDERWLVTHGQPDATMAGALLVTSRRHYVDFVDMTVAEANSFGRLLSSLDGALRAVTDAERVHVVSTRDRIEHFHAWLYPRAASHPLRGTAFLNAPQRSDAESAEQVARDVRCHLETAG
jgi:diadenosine tetraphosphate (Ap4A) HIT family hydrolase